MRLIMLSTLCILCVLPGVLDADSRYDELLKQANEYKQKDDWANLEAAMGEALGLNDSDEYVGRTYSWAQMLQGKTQEAVKSAEANVRRHPCGWSYQQLAEALWANGDLKAAHEAIDKALDMEKNQKTGAYDSAIATHDKLARKHYHFEFTIDPQTTWPRGGEIAIGMPTLSGDHQGGTYKLANVKSSTEFHDPGGNLLLKVIPKGKEKFQLVVDMIIAPHSMKGRFAARKNVPLPDDLKVYLGAATVWGNKDCIDPSSRLLRETVAPLKSNDDVETVRNIAKWMAKIRYQEIAYKSVDEVVTKGYGHCDATANLMTGLCRAAGIPARSIRIFTVPAGKESGNLGAHSMCEAYIGGVGWVPVNPGDPSGLGSLDSNAIRLFHYAFEGADGRLFNLGSLNPPETSFTMHYED